MYKILTFLVILYEQKIGKEFYDLWSIREINLISFEINRRTTIYFGKVPTLRRKIRS